MKNIPSTNFKANDTVSKATKAIVQQNVSTVLDLSRFSIIQLIYGAKNEILQNEGSVEHSVVLLYMILNEKFFESSMDTDILILEVERNQVIIMRKWIEARLLHCEKERDDRNPKFNPDTYIHLKMLLLDIREWLSGDVLEIIGD
jgi:hypothetical protein